MHFAFCRLKTYVGNAINTASAAPAWLAAKAVPVAADGAGLLRNAAADRVALFRRGCAPRVSLFFILNPCACQHWSAQRHSDRRWGGATPVSSHPAGYIVLYVVNWDKAVFTARVSWNLILFWAFLGGRWTAVRMGIWCTQKTCRMCTASDPLCCA